MHGCIPLTSSSSHNQGYRILDRQSNDRLEARRRARDERPCGRSSGRPREAGRLAVRHRHKRCGASSSTRLWFARYDGEHPLFKQARGRAVCVQMCRIDHDALRFQPFAREPGEGTVENTEAAPADETVVERLARTVASRRILPLQPVPDQTMPLTTRRSSTRATQCDSGKCGDIRAIWHSLSRNKSPITASSSENVNHITCQINRS